jgi:cytochrome P450
MSQAVDLTSYDPMERSTQQDPFPYYAALRRDQPVYKHPRSGIYFISRMSTLSHVLSKPLLFSSQAANAQTPPKGEVAKKIVAIMADGYPRVNTMLTCDPPAQTRYRKSVGKPFTSRRVKQLDPVMRDIARDLIDAWPSGEPFSFASAFALPLPVRAIAYALTMDLAHEADIKRWSDDAIAALGVQIPDERRLAAARGVVEQQNYWVSRFDACRADPVDDIVSNLVNADFEDHTGTVRKLEDPELISIVQQFMVAGNETTTKLLNEAIRLLIENPLEWKRIKDDPSTIPNMVEEALRLSTPNQGMFRTATEDTELEGVSIPKGSTLWIIFGSANRDESIFPEPDRFDPTRPNLKEHIAFGKGTHLCPGAPLARLESVVAFEEIVKRVESFEFAPGFVIEYEPSFILRGLAGLDVIAKKA